MVIQRGNSVREPSDIVIVGGGLAGMSVALMLSMLTEYNITLLEKRTLAFSETPNTDSRPISLAHASVSILKALGLWESLLVFASPIKDVLVSESGAFGSVHFRAADWQLNALGQVVPIDCITHVLSQQLQGSRVELITDVCVSELQQVDNKVSLTYTSADGESTTLRPACVIASDGAASIVRSCLPIDVKPSSSKVTISVVECVCDEPHQARAEQRFVPGHGVLASVPLFDSKRVRVIWTRGENDSDAMAKISDDAYKQWCQKEFLGRLSIVSLSRQAEFSITPQSAAAVVKGRVVLLGDAARTVPPLAAQGFNLTLSDAAALVETMVQAEKTHPGSGTHADTLARYARWRSRSNDRLPRFLKASQDMFSYTIPGLSCLRSGALTLINSVPGLRRLIGKRLLGLSGKVPALARGVMLDELKESLLCHDQ